MKTSNIIMLTFLAFLFGGMTVFCIDSKHHEENKVFNNFEKKLTAFSVIVAENGAKFNLKNGNECKITQTYIKGTLPNIDSFAVRNDTLFVSSKIPKNGMMKHTDNVTEIFCRNTKSIVAKENSDIQIKEFHKDTLNITMKKAILNCKINKLTYLSVNADESNVTINCENIKKIDLKLDETKLDLSSKKNTENISGILINNSSFNGKIDGKINLEVDKSSKVYF